MRCGIDLIDVQRVERLVNKYGARFVRRIFTPAEQAYCNRRKKQAPHWAVRVAGKEAVAKALGTGLGRVAWTDIEILISSSGEPAVTLYGEARRCLDALGGRAVRISLTHTNGMAAAVALLE